jgi:site-specific DNA-cytosine methylase
VLESEVDDKYFLSEKGVDRIMSYNNADRSLDDNNKSLCLASGYYKQGRDNQLIVHNTMPRSGDPKKGGTGPLSRNDGKTYCLDTGNTNAVEVISMDYRYDEGFIPRQNGKSPTLTITNDSNSFSGKPLAQINSRIRRLTPIECERLQTVKDNYTNYVSDSQRYKMLGNGWTVEVITHIFKYIKQ